MRLLIDSTNREAAKARDPLDRIVRATRAYLLFFREHPGLVELFLQERAVFRGRRRPTYSLHRDANMGVWHDLLRALMRAGKVRPMPVARITDVFDAALYGAIFTNHFEGKRRPPGRQARDILDIVFHGILSRKAGVQGTRGGTQ